MSRQSVKRPGKAPCKDCEERVLGCHASCQEYQTYSKELEKFRKAIQKQKALDNIEIVRANNKRKAVK